MMSALLSVILSNVIRPFKQHTTVVTLATLQTPPPPKALVCPTFATVLNGEKIDSPNALGRAKLHYFRDHCIRGQTLNTFSP